MPLEYLCLAALSFLSGGVLFSYHLPMMMKGVDVTRESADHNPGTANAVKYAGVPVGMLCLAADVLKGFLPVSAALHAVGAESMWFSLILAAPVAGHALAVFYRMPGGKAIAVSFGALLAILPVSKAFWVLAGGYIVFSTIAPIRPDERRSVAAFALLAAWALMIEVRRQASVALGCMAIALTVIHKNREPRKRSFSRA